MFHPSQEESKITTYLVRGIIVCPTFVAWAENAICNDGDMEMGQHAITVPSWKGHCAGTGRLKFHFCDSL